jgi:hypothetical protein
VVPFLLAAWNVLTTVWNNAELNGRFERGWKALDDRSLPLAT